MQIYYYLESRIQKEMEREQEKAEIQTGGFYLEVALDL